MSRAGGATMAYALSCLGGLLLVALAVWVARLSGPEWSSSHPVESFLTVIEIDCLVLSPLGALLAVSIVRRGDRLRWRVVAVHAACSALALAVPTLGAALVSGRQLGEMTGVWVPAVALVAGVTVLGACVAQLSHRAWVAPSLVLVWAASTVAAVLWIVVVASLVGVATGWDRSRSATVTG